MCVCGEPGKEATFVHVPLPFSFEVGYAYGLRACRGACMNTLPVVLYSLGQGYVCHPNESLARASVYSWPVTGCKSGARAKIYTASHKTNIPLVRSVVSSWSYYVYAQFCFGGLSIYF